MPLYFTPVTSHAARRLCETIPKVYPDGMVRISPSECVLPTMYQKDAQKILDVEVREDDVWVVTYPKSGTTWTQEMVWLLVNNLDYEGARVRLTERFPFLDYTSFVKSEIPNGIQVVQKLASPRCIKSHLPVELLPKQLWTKKPKIIYVTRDPKDVAVSYHHHLRLVDKNATHTLEDFVEAFLEGNVPFGPYWNHVLDFWKLKNESHVLFNTYEEMKVDLPIVIRRTAKFLGKDLTTQQVARLAEHLSFSSMKKNSAVNYEDKQPKDWDESKGPRPAFMRKGEVGDGHRSMSQEMAERFGHWTVEKTMGTSFQYYGAK